MCSCSRHNQRKHSDIIYHRLPEQTEPRRLVTSNLVSGAKIDSIEELYYGAAKDRYGPRAGVQPDIAESGLSWNDMRRRGMLRRSASDMVLMPASSVRGAFN